MAGRPRSAGRPLAGQWAGAEFAALVQLFLAGVPVPYPVSVVGTEVLLEFIGEPDGTGAPGWPSCARPVPCWSHCGTSWSSP